jgi:predicted phosphodiesterase
MLDEMKAIAVLADIHGNVPALEAVLDDLRTQCVDEVLVGGDLVGRGPEGSKVVRRLAGLGWRGVRGNHEDYLLGFRRREVPADWWDLDEWSAARWMAAELDDDDARHIDALPMQLHSEVAPDLCLVHGSPRSHSEGLGPWSTDDELRFHLGRIEGRVLVCGHTHRPLHRRFDCGLVVNVGAVGLPFNRDRRAQYAILRASSQEWEVEFRQVDYDIDRTLQAYVSSGFLDEGGVTAQLLRLELTRAAPFLVPFIKWSHARDQPVAGEHLEAFLEFYDPAKPLRTFHRKLRDLC